MRFFRIRFICLLALPAMLFSCQHDGKYTGWPVYKGSEKAIQYSSLNQIDTGNVQKLRKSWTYHTRDADTLHHSQIQCNPIVVDGILYGVSPQMKLFAINAADGNEKWVFNPFDSLGADKKMFFILNNCRGVSYWSDGGDDKRLYYTAGSNLYCIHAVNGRPVESFGVGGKIDLHRGLDRDVPDLFITATTPPMIFKDLLIMGSRVDEGAAAAPGHIRAFDVRTGERKWIFHTIPHPGEAGYSTWDDPQAYTFIGGANAWSGFSLDKERGILFAVTGSASFDFYGGKRTGNGLYANCVIALDAATGKHIWHFQTIHHDVWDRDLSSPPVLVTVKKNGNTIDAVAVTTKTGFVFVFDRQTGKPVYDIIEKAVPDSSGLAGEKLSSTQPVPVAPPPFMRQAFTEKEINPLLGDSSFREVKERLLSYKHDNMFNPPSLQGTVVFPGLDGGGEWGGPTYDPETGILYVNANEMAWVIQAVDIRNTMAANETYDQAGRRLYQSNCMTCHGPERKGSGNFPSLVEINKKYSPKSFDQLIQSGRRMMPAFKQLNDNEREAIASFILNIENGKTKKYRDSSGTKNVHAKLPYSITGYNKFLSKEGYPALAPPWGTLQALDLNSGNYVWKTTLGSDTAIKNSKEPTGTENYGGSVVTRGGVLFMKPAVRSMWLLPAAGENSAPHPAIVM